MKKILNIWLWILNRLILKKRRPIQNWVLRLGFLFRKKERGFSLYNAHNEAMHFKSFIWIVMTLQIHKILSNPSIFGRIKISQERKRKCIMPAEWAKIRKTFPMQNFALHRRTCYNATSVIFLRHYWCVSTKCTAYVLMLQK